MKITDLIKSRVFDNTRSNRSGAAETQANETDKRDPSAALAEGDDVITISPLARQYAQFSKIVGDDEVAHQQRLDDIKERVANGTYQVDSETVAQSIVDYGKE